MISVHYFGTCRIHAPLTHLAELGEIRLLDGAWSFLHSPTEILQTIEYNKGAVEIDESHAYLASFVKGLTKCDINAADVFVVEVSSVKAFKYFNTEAQLNRIREKTVALDESLDAWFKALEREGHSDHISDTDLEYNLSDFSCKKLHEDEILILVSKILERLGKPTVLVSSFNYPDNRTKEFLPVRTSLINTLKKTESSNLLGFFDPTILLEEYGFEQNTTDSAHYRESFIPIVANKLKEYIQQGTAEHV